MKQIFAILFVFSLFTSIFTFESHAAPPAPVPQTGQTLCYNETPATITCAGTGQDGEMRIGLQWPSPRFVDNSVANSADQTVTDNLTDLIWSKNANPAAGAKTWQQALDYIKSLNASNYLGHNDWHLPNVNELKSLVNQGQSVPATWLNSQGFLNVQSDNYWSSTTSLVFSRAAWYVYMKNGVVNNTYGKAGGSYVWPVRVRQIGTLTLSKTGQTTCYDTLGVIISCGGTGQDGDLQNGSTWPSTRFSANSDLSATDNLTGLIWSKNANPAAGGKTWQQALDYIKSLNSSNYLGHNDWRLHNVNELAIMVNRGQSNSATWLNGQGFFNVQSNDYWSSTTFTYYSAINGARSVGLSFGQVGGEYGKAASLFVWPVRGGQYLPLLANKTGTGSGTITSSTGGINCGSTCSVSINSGASVTLSAAPSDSGSTFTGWTGACSGTGTCTVTMDVAKSVTATFDLAPVNGACDATSNGKIFSIAPTSSLCTSTGATPVVTGTGPWGWNCTGLNKGTDVSCSALLEVPLALALVGTGSGSVSGEMSCMSGKACPPKLIVTGTDIILYATPNGISTFDGWFGDCTGTNNCILNINSAKTVNATFNLAPKAMIGTTGYASFSEAYKAASSSTATTIMLLEDVLPITTTIGKSLTLRGGHLPNFDRSATGYTTLQGPLIIRSGSLIVDRVAVK